MPRVSFGIPAYRRPDLLREALASIAEQDAADAYEIVVCDDGGLPETARAVADFPGLPLTFHRNEQRLGAVQNWNRCLELARGDWVSILHEDDLLLPQFLSFVTPRLRDNLAAVATRVVQGRTMPAEVRRSRTTAPSVREYRPRYFLKSSFTPFPGVLFRREIALRLGGFDTRWGSLADYEFWYRLAQAAPVEIVCAPGAFSRVSEGQWTETEWPVMLRRMHLLRLRIAREQLPHSPRLGRWLARFFTHRNALAYAARFSDRPATLARALQLRKIPLHALPSGWVWQALKTLG